MKGQIDLQRVRPGTPAVPAKLSLTSQGNYFFIRIKSSDGLDVWLKSDALTFAQTLEPMVEDMRAALGQIRRHEPAAPNWDWLTPEYVIEYFEKSPILANMAADVRKVLESEIAVGTQTASETPHQIDQDLATIAPIADQLIDDDGELRWGAQSKVATALGITNAGGYRDRILAALDKLKRAA